MTALLINYSLRHVVLLACSVVVLFVFHDISISNYIAGCRNYVIVKCIGCAFVFFIDRFFAFDRGSAVFC